MNVTVTGLLEQCAAVGLTVTAHDGQVQVRGKGSEKAVPLIAQVRERKAEILEILGRRNGYCANGRYAPDMGAINAGVCTHVKHYGYTINEQSALYKPELSAEDYKRWLWSAIQDNEQANDLVVNALYEVINGAYVGCDVYVDGPNAGGVVAASRWLAQQCGRPVTAS